MLKNRLIIMQLGFLTAVAILIGGVAATPAAYGQATSTTSVVQVPFVSGVVPACPGFGPIAFSGTINIVTHETIGPSGTTLYFINNFNFQDAKATDVTTGATGTISENSATTVETTISPTVIQEELNGHIIIQKVGLEPGSHMTFLVVFNANGQPTVTLDHVDLTCPHT